jgi:hypothetical protein
MRINAGSKLTANDVYEAARVAREHGQDFHIEELAVSPRGAITFYGESFSGKRRVNRQGRSDAYAATWQAWGWFIAELFNRDPNATIGYYKGVRHFRNECQKMHEQRRAYGFRTQDDPGRDISFLDHLNDQTGVGA